jgi:hypothetical protein
MCMLWSCGFYIHDSQHRDSYEHSTNRWRSLEVVYGLLTSQAKCMELVRKSVSHRKGNPGKASANRLIKQGENTIHWKHNGHKDNLNLSCTVI